MPRILWLLWQRLRSLIRPRARPEQQVELERRLAQLEAAVHKLVLDLAELAKELVGQTLDIHIDKVCIDKINLDQLVFNIDGIGVKDLSGSLSIGINYGGKVIRLLPSSLSPENPPPAAPSKRPPPSPGGQPRINFGTDIKEGGSL